MISGRTLHEFSVFGKTYIFDANRLQAFRLGPRALHIWEQCNKTPLPATELQLFSADADRDIWQSLADNHLVPPHLSLTPEGKPPRKISHVNFFMLHIVEGCNMRCHYCFSEGGSYGGPNNRMMSKEVGYAAIDFLLENCANGVTPQLMFFGGEPLLNYQLIESLISYAEAAAKKRVCGIAFSMTTNATLFNFTIIETLVKHNVGVLVSIDGIGAENDIHRIMPDGQGSFRHIASRLRPLLEQRKTTARATLALGNVDIEKIVLDLLRFGFQGVQVSVTGAQDPLTLCEADWQLLLASLERLIARYMEMAIDGNLLPFSTFHEEVCALAERRIDTRGCAAGRTYFNVLPDGTINVCTRSVGGPAPFYCGSVVDGEFNHKVQDYFESRSVDTHPICSGCWARYRCSGGCFARNMAKDGSDDRVDVEYCRFQKRFIELAVAVDFELTLLGIDPASLTYTPETLSP